jgi:hypothetical protein
MGWQPKPRGAVIGGRYRLATPPAADRLADAVDGDAPAAHAAVRLARIPAGAGGSEAWADAWRIAAAGSRAVPGIRDVVLDGDVAWAVLESEPRPDGGPLAAQLRDEAERLGAALAGAGLSVDAVHPGMLGPDGTGGLALDGVVPLASASASPHHGARTLRDLLPLGEDDPPWEAEASRPPVRSPTRHPRDSGRGRRRLVIGATLIALGGAAALLVLPGVQARSQAPAAPDGSLTLVAPEPTASATMTVVETAPAETEVVTAAVTVTVTVVEAVAPAPSPPSVPDAPVLPTAEVPSLPAPDLPMLSPEGAGVPALAASTGG